MKRKMVNITPICVKYNKKPSHFLDNMVISELIKAYGYNVSISRGRYGGTYIDQDLMKEFYLWLSPETRLQVLKGELP